MSDNSLMVRAVLGMLVAVWLILAGVARAGVATTAATQPVAGASEPAVATAPAGAAGAKAATTEDAPDGRVLTRGLVPGSRELKVFDFEEEKLGNYEALPMFWNKVTGRGFPRYTGGAFDSTVYRSAGHSFKLQLDGGSVAYQLAPGRLPVSPSADYLIVGYVKTTALTYARADVRGWFADAAGKLLPQTEARTARWASATGQDDWHVVYMYMPGVNPAAQSLVLQMELLQPQQYTADQLGPFELYQQDIKGAAWFDDITVYELPRVRVRAPTTAGLFGPGQAPALDLTISDLGNDGLRAQLSVDGADGTNAVRSAWTVASAPTAAWTQHVALGALPAGLYTATLDVLHEGTVIVRRQTRFAVLAPLPGAPGAAPEFGLAATDWPVEAWDELPEVAGQLGVGLIKLPAWRRDMSEDALQQRDQPFDTLIAQLQRREIGTIASFAQIPSILAQRLNEQSDSVVGLLDVDPNIWRPYVSFILARYANRINQWEIGRYADAFYSNDPRYPRLYARVHDELAALLSAPRVLIPWNALYDFDPQQYPGAVLDLVLPAVIKPTQIPFYIDSFKQTKTSVLAMVAVDDTAAYPRLDQLADFAERVVLARVAGPEAVLIDLPLVRKSDLTEQATEPLERLVVYRTLVRELGGAVSKGAIDLAPGVRAYLFDRKGLGTLVLWNQDAQTPVQALELSLGRTPYLVDLLGRRTPLPVHDGVCRIEVGSQPVLVDTVDSRLAELRASFQFATRTLPAGKGVVATQLLLSNPYDEPLTGTLQLAPPRDWAIDPATMTVSVPPGATMERPVTIRYPYAEFAGSKEVRARLSTERDRGEPVDLATHLEVASDRVEMECFALLMPGDELSLQQMITNTGTRPLNAQAFVLLPGLPRQQRFVLDLQPNQTMIKRFTISHAGGLKGKTAAVGLRLTDGRTLLTKAVPLE